MIHPIQKFFIASITAALVGCASPLTTLPKPLSSGDTAPTRSVPVPIYVMPKCQSLGGNTHCQWIEPPGLGSEQGQESEPSVKGIAL